MEDGDFAVEERGAEEESPSLEWPCEGPSNGRVSPGDARSRSPIRPAPGPWKTKEEPDVAPAELQFSPSRTPGVQPPVNSRRASALDIFQCFFDLDVLELLCSNTNRNAARQQERDGEEPWWDMTEEELRKFIGLLLFVGVVDPSRISRLWRTDDIFAVPFPSTVMTQDRFEAIMSVFHLSDSTEEQNGLDPFRRVSERLHQAQPLMELLRSRCRAVYHPQQNISVYERMAAIEAELNARRVWRSQIIKAKKCGLKFFVLVDSNGYTVDYRLHAVRTEPGSGHSLAFDVVTSLLDRDWLGTGYIVYCDDYFTSPQLFTRLSEQGFGACGTCRPGRTGFPRTKENDLSRASPRGSVRWIREGSLLFMKWKDGKEVSLCSTVHSAYGEDTALRWRRQEDGSQEQVRIPRPTAVREYKRYKGGVDITEELLKSAQTKTRRWHVTVFYHLLDMVVANSFIVSKELAAARGERLPTRLQFEKKLIAQLCGVSMTSPPPQPPGQPPGQRRVYHCPVVAREGVDNRCVLCGHPSPWTCKVCDVVLCVEPHRNCYEVHHRGVETHLPVPV